ncbi:MAG: keto-deoxy-phosphogluconate aldolase, partial [Pirellulales bacterium]
GARFGVAPGTNRSVIERATQRGLPFFPGVTTPSDIESALELGCRVLKFFPAEASGGLNYLRSMAAPYEHLQLRYLPLGGIGPANLKSYLADPRVLGVGGSWIAPREMIASRQWDTITERAREAQAMVDSVRR